MRTWSIISVSSYNRYLNLILWNMLYRIVFNLDYAYLPRLKCGVEVGAAVVAGIAAVGGAAIAADSAESNTNKQLTTQKSENEKNRNFNAQQAELARNFADQQRILAQEYTTGERIAQQDYQMHEWQRQFDMTNQYNLPTEQANRLRAAGVNPMAALGGNANLSANVATPSAPSGNHVSTPSAAQASFNGGVSPVAWNNPTTMMPQMLTAIGSVFNNLAQAKKTGVDTVLLEKTLKSRIIEADEKAKQATFDTIIKEVASKMSQAELPYIAKKKWLEFANAYATFKNTESKTELNKAYKVVQDSVKSLNEALTRESNLRGDKMDLLLPFTLDEFSAQLALMKSERSKNLSQVEVNQSQSELNFQNARSVDELRGYQINDLIARINKTDEESESISVNTLRSILGYNDHLWNDLYHRLSSNIGKDKIIKKKFIENWLRTHSRFD